MDYLYKAAARGLLSIVIEEAGKKASTGMFGNYPNMKRAIARYKGLGEALNVDEVTMKYHLMTLDELNDYFELILESVDTDAKFGIGAIDTIMCEYNRLYQMW